MSIKLGVFKVVLLEVTWDNKYTTVGRSLWLLTCLLLLHSQYVKESL